MYKVSFRLSSLLLLFSLAASILTGCSPKGGQSEVKPIELTTTVTDLKGEELIMGSPFLMRVGDYLVISDFKTDSVITVIDTKSSTNLGSFFRNGEGPEEYGKITLLGRSNNSDNQFLISDPNKRCLHRVKLGNAEDEQTAIASTVAPPDSSFWYVEQLANKNLITSNGYVDYIELFSIFDENGKFIGRTGQRLIPDEHKGYKPVDLTAAYQYTLSVSPDGSRVAAIGMGERAMFYSLRGDSLVMTGQICNPEADPAFVFTPDGYMGVDGQSKIPWGFTSGVASDEGIFILKSDLPFCDDNSHIADRLLFYDWDGNLQADYRLDRRVSQISSPGPDGKMYAIVVDDSDPTLVTIDLPQ